MTSFGIEWDTQSLLFIPDIKKLPDKTVIYKDDSLKLLISAEDWGLFKKRQPPPDACLQTIEIILGVFYSDDKDAFNLTSFNEYCAKFQQFWNNLNNEGRTLNITLPDNSKKEAHLLTYMPEKFIIPKEIPYYRDCARKEKEQAWTIIQDNKEQNWGYIDDIASVKGNPQITIGFALEKYYKMVKFITNVYSSSGSTSNSLDKLKLDLAILQKDPNFNIYSDKCKSLILMIIKLIGTIQNYWKLSEEERTGTYPKAQLLKLRTNPYYIYTNMLSPSEQKQFTGWFDRYYKDNRDNNIIKLFRKRWNNPAMGQIIINMKECFPNSNLPSMGIFTMDNATKRRLNRINVQVKDIMYLPNFWNVDNVEDMSRQNIGFAPQIELVSADTNLKYKDNTNNELLFFDYGEWYSNVDENIVVELRGLHLWYNLFTQQADISTKIIIRYEKLCSYIYTIMGWLNVGLIYV